MSELARPKTEKQDPPIEVAINKWLKVVTEKAVGMASRRGGEADVDYWIPRSQIFAVDYGEGLVKEYRKGERVKAMRLAPWIAREKGLLTEPAVSEDPDCPF